MTEHACCLLTNGKVERAEHIVELLRQKMTLLLTVRIGALPWVPLIGWPLLRTAAARPRSRRFEDEIVRV
jgi:hypothetical protein